MEDKFGEIIEEEWGALEPVKGKPKVPRTPRATRGRGGDDAVAQVEETETFGGKEGDEDKFGIILEDRNSPWGEIGRHTARSASRAVEAIGGGIGDFMSLVPEGPGKVARAVTGLSQGLPTSAHLKDLSHQIFGSTTTAHSPGEELADDIVGDVASLIAGPGRGAAKGAGPFLKQLGRIAAIGTGANLAPALVKSQGGGPKAQGAAKLGAFFLGGLTGKGNVKTFWKDQYQKAEKSIPSKEKIQAFKLGRKLDKLQHELQSGVSTPSKSYVLKPLKELRTRIKKGTLPAKELPEIKRNLNELRASLFTDVGSKGGRTYARRKINDLSAMVDQEIKDYGKTNPQFLKHQIAADEAYGGFHQSQKLGKWIKRSLPFRGMGKGSLLLLEALFKPAALKYTIPGMAAFKTGEILARIGKNATLRSYYTNLMKEGVKENAPAFIRQLNKLTKELEKEDPELFSSRANHKDSE